MRSLSNRRLLATAVAVGATSLVIAGCSGGGGTQTGPGDYGDADGVVTLIGTIADTEAGFTGCPMARSRSPAKRRQSASSPRAKISRMAGVPSPTTAAGRGVRRAARSTTAAPSECPT